jgi:hypothetical protein
MRVIALAALSLVAIHAAGAQDAPKPGQKVPVRRPAAGPSADALPNPLPLKFTGPPTTGAITPLDMMTRLYKFADDSMMGRLAGTPWNDKGTDYIASELQRLGLQPAGDSGTFFQHPLVRREPVATSWIGVGDRRWELWTDFAPRDQGTSARSFDGVPVVYGGVYGDTLTMIKPAQAAGKVVLLKLRTGKDGKPDINVNRFALTSIYRDAAAIAVAQLDYLPEGYLQEVYRNAQVAPRTDAATDPARPSYFYVTDSVARAMLGTTVDSATMGRSGATMRGQIAYEAQPAPGRNVLAILPGSDPALRGQYVVIGAHDDHVGFNDEPVDHDSVKALMMHAAPQGADSPQPKPTAAEWVAINKSIDSLRKLHPSRMDSIFNGADDDGSGSMALLEIAERFATSGTRPKRSIMFAWHVAEELGLWGSAYFTDHPTVPRDSIVAELNIDMVGRGGSNDITGATKEGALIHGGPGYVQLVGARRLSTELGDLVERTNATGKIGLRFDYSLDANGHPQNIYCRSDHYMYARYGIPIVFFTTGGHADYHQVTDEPQYIDYRRMAQVATLIHASATNVANLDHRVTVDKAKPNPQGSCQQ